MSKFPHGESIKAARTKHNSAYRLWTPNEDRKLLQALARTNTLEELEAAVGRSPNAVMIRLHKILDLDRWGTRCTFDQLKYHHQQMTERTRAATAREKTEGMLHSDARPKQSKPIARLPDDNV